MTTAIGASAAALAAAQDDLAVRFYDLLFAHSPQLRGLFDAELSDQRRRLLGELGYLIGLADQPGQLEARAEELGRRHAGYGVTQDHVIPFGTALLAAIREVVGEPLATTAWAPLIDRLLRSFSAGLVQSR